MPDDRGAFTARAETTKARSNAPFTLSSSPRRCASRGKRPGGDAVTILQAKPTSTAGFYAGPFKPAPVAPLTPARVSQDARKRPTIARRLRTRVTPKPGARRSVAAPAPAEVGPTYLKDMEGPSAALVPASLAPFVTAPGPYGPDPREEPLRGRPRAGASLAPPYLP